MKKYVTTFVLVTIVHVSYGASWTGSEILMYGIVGLSIVLSLVALILVASNMMNLEASKHGIDVQKQNFSAVPGADDFGNTEEGKDKHS